MSKNKDISHSNKRKIKYDIINRDKAALAVRIQNMKSYGRKTVTTKEELEKYPIGSLISYKNNNNVFRNAGFIDKFESNSFVYCSLDFKQRVRVKYSCVKKMWVGDVRKITGDFIGLAPSTSKETKHFVEIDSVVIYYARDLFTLKRFKSSEKYKTIMKWYDRYKNFLNDSNDISE